MKPRSIDIDDDWSGYPTVTYNGGALFLRVCGTCGRYVVSDVYIRVRGPAPDEYTIDDRANAFCGKCGRTEMPFIGFVEGGDGT